MTNRKPQPTGWNGLWFILIGLIGIIVIDSIGMISGTYTYLAATIFGVTLAIFWLRAHWEHRTTLAFGGVKTIDLDDDVGKHVQESLSWARFEVTDLGNATITGDYLAELKAQIEAADTKRKALAREARDLRPQVAQAHSEHNDASRQRDEKELESEAAADDLAQAEDRANRAYAAWDADGQPDDPDPKFKAKEDTASARDQAQRDATAAADEATEAAREQRAKELAYRGKKTQHETKKTELKQAEALHKSLSENYEKALELFIAQQPTSIRIRFGRSLEVMLIVVLAIMLGDALDVINMVHTVRDRRGAEVETREAGSWLTSNHEGWSPPSPCSEGHADELSQKTSRIAELERQLREARTPPNAAPITLTGTQTYSIVNGQQRLRVPFRKSDQSFTWNHQLHYKIEEVRFDPNLSTDVAIRMMTSQEVGGNNHVSLYLTVKRADINPFHNFRVDFVLQQ